MLTKGEVRCGDILWTQFDPSVGHEFQDKRPALVIQSNEILAKSNLVTVMPMTSNMKNKTADDLAIDPDDKNNLKVTSIIKTYNITSCDYQRFCGKIGAVNEVTMDTVRKYLRIHFGL